MGCEQQIRFNAALHRGRLIAAEQAINNLASVSRLDADFCRCQLLSFKSDSSTLLRQVDSLLCECRHRETSQQHFTELIVRLLLLKGDALCSTDNASLAMSPLLEALTLAKQSHCTLLTSLATVHLALVQYHVGLPQLALNHLCQVYSDVMCHGSLSNRAFIASVAVKCQLSVGASNEQLNRADVLRCVVSKLDHVIAWLRQLDSHQRLKQALYLQSRVYDELGSVTLRNKCAAEFRQLDQQYPTWNSAAAAQL